MSSGRTSFHQHRDRRPRPDRRIDRARGPRALAVDPHHRRSIARRCWRTRRAAARSIGRRRRVADIGGHDLVILAAPVAQNVQLLAQRLPRIIGDGGLITDVGGTKRDIVSAAAALPGVRAAFVGGHPIGGAEQGGFAFARPICSGAAVDLHAKRRRARAPARRVDLAWTSCRGLGAQADDDGRRRRTIG